MAEITIPDAIAAQQSAGSNGDASRNPWAELISTATCRKALLADLRRIRIQLEIGFAERIRDTRALGGAVSNADYAAILDERERTMESLDRLDRVLERATVVDEAAWPRISGRREARARRAPA
jgi:hypothetical protein